MRPLLIRGMWGLGDNIYARPFVRAASKVWDVYLETPWPELYEDLPVRFVRGDRALRTQIENVRRQPDARWTKPPLGVREVRVQYTAQDLHRGSIVTSLERQFGMWGVKVDQLTMDLPDLGPSPLTTAYPLAVVRPVTVRTEWRNEARNPLPEYVSQVAEWLVPTHTVVSVAHLAPGQEWAALPLPPAAASFLSGQFAVRELLALVKHADVVVGGVGWIVPAALATGTPTFVILGGQGGHNTPEKILDPRLPHNIGFARPQRFCLCTDKLHRCDKRIPNLKAQWDHWALGRMSLAVA